MSLFQCYECGCRENTATCNFWSRMEGQWRGLEPQPWMLCSACDPAIGEWHDRFPRRFLPKGMFITNAKLRAALTEKGERREAVAWIVPDFGFLFPTEDAAQRYLRNINDLRKPTALYTSPQPGPDVLAMAEYLDQFSNNAYTKHRGLWIQIYAFAVAKGMAERNCAELTLQKKEQEKVRQRHTVEGVQKILDAETTPAWLKRAIRLALLSLQRREDLVTWERAAVDMSRNVIRVSPGKTENYGTPIHLEIEMGTDLRAVVQECLKEPIASPYLICYRPRARKREQIEAKLHWSAVTDDYLTKEFRKARDLAKAYDHIENPKARPTMHELRALGSWLYEQQGFSTEYVQVLMGHATPDMTAYYQDGHEQKEVIYQHVAAGLKL